MNAEESACVTTSVCHAHVLQITPPQNHITYQPRSDTCAGTPSGRLQVRRGARDERLARGRRQKVVDDVDVRSLVDAAQPGIVAVEDERRGWRQVGRGERHAWPSRRVRTCRAREVPAIAAPSCASWVWVGTRWYTPEAHCGACAQRPSPSCDCLSVDKPIAPPEVSLSEAAALRTLAVDLPASCGWRRLGRGSGWQVYSDEAARLVQKGAPVYVFAPSVVLAIDWSGCAAWRAMRAAWPSENPEDAPELGRAQPCTQPIPRMLYINFRVYSSGLLPDEADVSWYDEQETVALGLAERAFALSTRDQVTLNALIPSKSELRRGPGVGVLLPCLRGDMQVLAETPEIVHRVHLPPPALEAVAATEAAARASMEIPPGMQLATTARPMREGRCCVRCTPLQGEESSTLLSPDRDDS